MSAMEYQRQASDVTPRRIGSTASFLSSTTSSSSSDYWDDPTGTAPHDNNINNDNIRSSLSSKTTQLQSFVHLLKGYVGPGCLSLPWAFSQLGVYWGTIVCLVMSSWTSYNCWTVVQLKLRNRSERRAPSTNLSDAAASTTIAVATYPDIAYWLYGRKMHQFTTACICVQQLAICTVFLSFVGANLQAVLASFFELDSIGHVSVITLALPAVLALSFLPNLKALAPVTAIGTALLMLGLALLAVVVGIEWPNRPAKAEQPTVNWKQFPLAACAILYSFEGVCLILPVENAMERPRKFAPVFVSAMTASAAIFAVVAVMSVAAFGPVTNGSLTAFLLQKYSESSQIQGWIMAANAAVSLSVLVTYPLQLFPAIELLGPTFSKKFDWLRITRRSTGNGGTAGVTATDFRPLPDPDGSDVEANHSAVAFLHDVFGDQEAGTTTGRTAIHAVVGEDENEDDQVFVHADGSEERDDVTTTTDDTPHYQARIVLVLLTYVVAAAVPNVEALISLAGALAGSSTALLIPPFLELAWLRQQQQQPQPQPQDGIEIDIDIDNPYSINNRTLEWRIRKCYALIGMGLVFAGIGTFASLADIISIYTSSSSS